MRRVKRKLGQAWTPADFSDLGNRQVIDKNLQRLTKAGELRRIDRGLYDRPVHNDLTGKPSVPDYRADTEAVLRRDKASKDGAGIGARNDAGLQRQDAASNKVVGEAR